MEFNQRWKTAEAMALVALITNIMAKVALLLDSVMPEKIALIAQSLGIKIDTETYNSIIKNKNLVPDTVITKVDQLFPRIEDILLEQPASSDITKSECEVKTEKTPEVKLKMII